MRQAIPLYLRASVIYYYNGRYRLVLLQTTNISFQKFHSVVGYNYGYNVHDAFSFLVKVIYFSRLYASIGSHELKAFFHIKVPCLGVFFCHPSVHLWSCRQAFKVFAAGLHIYGADVHPVQIDNFYCYAIGSFLKQDVGTSVVFVGVSVFVKTGGHFAYGAEYSSA